MAVNRIKKSLVSASAIGSISFFEIGPLSSPQSLSSDPGKSDAAKVIGHLPYLNVILSEIRKTHFGGSDTGMSGAGAGAGKGQDGEPTKDDERTSAWKLWLSVKAVTPKFSSPRSLSSDPGKSDAAKVIGPLPYLDLMRLSGIGKSLAALETGALSSLDQFRPFNPSKFHVQEDSDKYGYAQSHYRGSDTGMSGAGAGGGKGQDGEPTKDAERTLAWKLRLSVKAVTPMFSASAKISLEKKSG